MSIIVAVHKNDRIVMAADSLTVFGDSEQVPQANSRSIKIGRIGNAIIGSAGWAIYDDVLRDHLAQNPAPDLSSHQAIFAFFLDLWRVLHERYTFVNDQAGNRDSPFGDLDTSFLIASPGGIFKVSSDLGVTAFNRFYAIGSGTEFALGAFHALYEHNDDLEEIATIAVEAAISMDVHCGGAIDVLHVQHGGKAS